MSKPEASLSENKSCDYLIIGTGTAGLALALKLPSDQQVLLLAKESPGETNSAMAQGGISAVVTTSDSFESHIEDTLVAGAGLCNETVVKDYITQAPERIKELLNWGVRFDHGSEPTLSSDEAFSKIDLNKEGGHSFRRILHFEDQTGQEIHRGLLAQVRSKPNITIIVDAFAVDLIMSHRLPMKSSAGETEGACIGCYALNKNSGQVYSIRAQQTILATGGGGRAYQYTSNWKGATGDGIAMAYRAGAEIANLEFMQFHPTCLFHSQSRNFLISEALRGEGGELVNANRTPFMSQYHPLKSLAPRDIVSRAIDLEMRKSGSECVYLDMTHHSREFLEKHFPHIFQKCLSLGIEMSKDPIPVVPAAHYLCGGVKTDINGKTSVPRLWAIGETACTGLHGANRLASNSLLECLTMAHNCSVATALEAKQPMPDYKIPDWVHADLENDDEIRVIHHMWDEIRLLMWNYVGIVRSKKRLERAQHRIQLILEEIKQYYSEMKMNADILELRNLALFASLTVECALQRDESRGIHSHLDFPLVGPVAKDSCVKL